MGIASRDSGLLFSAFVACVAGSACSGPPADLALPTVRDSAGVRIVENSAPAWGAIPQWRLGDAPILQIGETDGEPEYLFSSIRWTWRRGDGTIVVADSRAMEIRFFDSDGRIRFTSGAPGDGPGEYVNLSFAAPYPADSTLVWDSRSRRVTIIGPEGTLGRSWVLPPDAPGEVPPAQGSGQRTVTRASEVVGAFGDGTLLVTRPAAVMLDVGVVFRRNVTYLRTSRDGQLLDSVATYPEDEGNAVTYAQGAAAFAGMDVPNRPYPQPVLALAAGSALYVGPGHAYQIGVHRLDGSIAHLIRSDHVDLSMTAQAMEAYRQARRNAVRDPARLPERERELESLTFPPTLPPYEDLLVDAERFVWVRDFQFPGHTGPQAWSVFDPEGLLLGSVETPENLRIHQIGPDFILGVWTSDLGVPFVRVYSLERQ